MKHRENVLKRFLSDTKNHKVRILHDDGTFRRLRVQTQGTWCYGFDIVTWPGYLCYSGDMGCYVFARLDDMFQFFRARPLLAHEEPLNVKDINPGYWSEKLQARDKHDTVERFSLDKFKDILSEEIKGMDDEELLKAFTEEVIDELDRNEGESQEDAYKFVEDWEYKGKHIFFDMWDYSCTEYTEQFLWCCFAIVSTIAEYDRICKETKDAVTTD